MGHASSSGMSVEAPDVLAGLSLLLASASVVRQ